MTKYEKLMAMEDLTPKERAFLDCVDKRWYVETRPLSDGYVQGGNVTKIIRDKYGVPVCLQVKDGGEKTDYISVERISFFEPYNNFISDYTDYEDYSDTCRGLEEDGYVYDKDECVYRHPKTGHEFCW